MNNSSLKPELSVSGHGGHNPMTILRRAAVTILLLVLAAPVAGEGTVTKAAETAETELPRVAIVTTGGTIAEKKGPDAAGAVPSEAGNALVQSVPGLKDIARIEVRDLTNKDSSQMTPTDWLHLYRVVRQFLEQDTIAGVVVTHGTDTMAEAAFLLDVLLPSDKPVVFTGAMRTASQPGFDGPANILNAVQQVILTGDRNWGVTVTLNNYINAARNVRKTQTTNVQTFTSGEKGYLGYVFDGRVTQFSLPVQRVQVDLTGIDYSAIPQVPIMKDYAGSDGRFIRYALETGAQGIVVEGVGAGNVNKKTYEAIQEVLEHKLPIVITTKVPDGAVVPVYGDPGGGAVLKEVGVILGGDLSAEKARLLLLVALMRYGNDPHRLRSLFGELYR